MLLVDEEMTRQYGELVVGGHVVPCMGICVDTGKVYVFAPTAQAVRYRGRVYVVARNSELLAEVVSQEEAGTKPSKRKMSNQDSQVKEKQTS